MDKIVNAYMVLDDVCSTEQVVVKSKARAVAASVSSSSRPPVVPYRNWLDRGSARGF